MDNLRKIELFSSLDDATGERYGQVCMWKEYDANELVIDIDEETTDVRFIVSGLVRIINRFAVGKEVILAEMGQGEFFGELAAIDDELRSANVTTLNRSQICIMPRKIFLELISTSQDVNLQVMRVLAKRIRTL
ncbi:MAG: Crp/Fnr family transcriptional regulator, partial [Pseudomonadota bacterium]